jgi:hypothetical protein
MTPEKIYTVREVISSLASLTGQRIKVRGVLCVGRENHSIQDVDEAGFRTDAQSRLWVHYHHATLGTRERNLAKFNRLQVIAEAIPDISRKGHLRGFPGSLSIRHLEFCDS